MNQLSNTASKCGQIRKPSCTSSIVVTPAYVATVHTESETKDRDSGNQGSPDDQGDQVNLSDDQDDDGDDEAALPQPILPAATVAPAATWSPEITVDGNILHTSRVRTRGAGVSNKALKSVFTGDGQNADLEGYGGPLSSILDYIRIFWMNDLMDIFVREFNAFTTSTGRNVHKHGWKTLAVNGLWLFTTIWIF